MQHYYFFLDPVCNHFGVSIDANKQADAEFIWVDCTREDVVNRPEQWQRDLMEKFALNLNEFHLKDILNLEHPCTFDQTDDYDLLIFRKLITPEDQIETSTIALEQHEHVFGLSTTPISFILTERVLVTVREAGNQAVEAYIERIHTLLKREIDEQNKTRKLPVSTLDLSLRLLNSMVDGYLDLRVPLTKRVEYWQQQLLQGHRRFTQWHQLLQENMAFQQMENLCEEQIETLQELRDAVLESDVHLKIKKKNERRDLLLVRMNDLMSHIERIQKQISRLGVAVQAAIDLHFSAVANQTNENMRILAIITAVFAPLTLLTGIYGMNFEVIPGAHQPYGFWIMLLVMLITTCGLLYYFYRRHLVGRGEKSVIDMLVQQQKDQDVKLWDLIAYDPIRRTVKGTMKEVEKLTKFK